MTTPCFIFDLDGTLADDSHRVEHMKNGDWDRYFDLCDKDTPIEAVCIIARALSTHYPVVIFTGRSESVINKTKIWLGRNVGTTRKLVMRKTGDFRPNSVLKLEALAQLRAEGFEPLIVFEDQPQVARAYRSEGIAVAYVGKQEEFIEYKRDEKRT